MNIRIYNVNVLKLDNNDNSAIRYGSLDRELFYNEYIPLQG